MYAVYTQTLRSKAIDLEKVNESNLAKDVETPGEGRDLAMKDNLIAAYRC
jgi:hypothetical protein